MYFHKALVINLYCGFQYQQKGYFEGVPFKIFGVYSLFFFEGPTPRLVMAVKSLDKNLFRKEHLFTPCYLVYVNFAVEPILSP